nr:ABC transporter ATP-binding protein [Pseudofrankia sp. BMG5.36]
MPANHAGRGQVTDRGRLWLRRPAWPVRAERGPAAGTSCGRGPGLPGRGAGAGTARSPPTFPSIPRGASRIGTEGTQASAADDPETPVAGPATGDREAAAETAAAAAAETTEAAGTESAAFAVELRDITKTFPGVVANRDVSIRVRRGSVHAVVGENGAGKSTLMKTLYGMHRPDSGTILVDGEDVTLRSPADAIARGIGMVHQHFKLAENLTVLENVVLGAEPRKPGWRRLLLDSRQARTRINEIATRYGLDIRPGAYVRDLGIGERQRVEILKVLYRGARTLILDEPTAVLVPQEVDELFGALRDLVNEGLSIIFISHKLDEVLTVADDITVIRRGTTVGTVRPAEVTARQLAELMVGSELPSPEISEESVTDEVALTVEGLSVDTEDGRRAVTDVGFTVRRGEILGIAGVEGNGQAELIEAVMGIRPAATGRVLLGGTDVTAWPTRRRREAGVAYVPEDRIRSGLLFDSPLWENRMLGHQTRPPNSRGGLLTPSAARSDTRQIVAEYDVRTPSVAVAAGALSGGNQQKLIVGREMRDGPTLLVAAHPTRGVDVGAQAAIWDQLRAARREGLAVLLVSADLDELIGLSDTLRVILRGRLVAEADPRGVTPEDLGSAMSGMSRAPAVPSTPAVDTAPGAVTTPAAAAAATDGAGPGAGDVGDTGDSGDTGAAAEPGEDR